MKLKRNLFRHLAALAVGGFALIACEESTSSGDSGPMFARARINFVDSSRVPDSISWKTTTDSGHGRFGCDSLDCTDTLALADALGKDTARVSLWALGIRCGTIDFTQSGRSLYLDAVTGSIVHDTLDLKLLLAFRALRQSKTDSLAAFGTWRSDLVYHYAKFVFAQDTGYKGFPTTHPIGMSVDSVEKALVYWGAKSAKTWAQLVALGVGLSDSATIHRDAMALLAAGKLTVSDTSALFPRASIATDTIAPTVTKGTGTSSRTVVFDTISTTLSWAVSDNDGIKSITLNDADLAVGSTVSKTVSLAVGDNTFILVATDSNSNTSRDTVVITRGGDVTAPVIARKNPTVDTSVAYTTTSISASWTVTDAVKIGTVTINGTTINGSSNVYAITVSLSVGTNKIYVVATDSVGNKSTDTIKVVRNAAAPTLGSSSGNYIGTVYNTVTSVGADSIECSMDGTNWVTYTDTVKLSDTGTFTLYAKAWPGGAISSATYAISRIEMIALGNYHTVFVKTDGSLWATGKNNDGQLGTGNMVDTSLPVRILQSGVSAVSAGYYHTLVLKKDGALYGTGYNSDGELGNGSTADLATLTQIASGVSSVSAGLYHSTYVTTSGSLMGAGINNMGQLGTSGSDKFTSFRQIDSDVGAASASGGFTLYLKSTNLYGCGSNALGQLGSVDTSTRWSPSLLASGVSGISAGWNYSLWIKSSNDTLWATGDNTYGQLGDNSFVTAYVPIRIPLASIISMATGWSHSLAVASDGTLYGMGYAGDGELGAGGMSTLNAPTKIMSNVSKAFAGGRQSFILKTDGTIWAAGRNTDGELGDGTRANAYSFKRINF